MSKRNPHVLCPAGEVVHPLLSLNPADVRYRIQGTLRPAAGSPCCGAYASCSIYRAARRIEMNKKRQLKEIAQTRAEAKPDVGNFTRDAA